MRVSTLFVVWILILYFPSTPDGLPISTATNSTNSIANNTSTRHHVDHEIVFLTSPHETSTFVIADKRFWIPFLILVCMFVGFPLICFCCWCCDQVCGCCKDDDQPTTFVSPKYVDENNNAAEEHNREYENLHL
ncbi:hypothetical protein M3Y94_00070200 [Aphelenchoides besseyi]|nr:hypothetical protein M3Y94_00070200 [Aphelenchoides besseyi]KAI6237880.1 hypothetical protein M3Y95_00311300 [Aphelenchoides besseyi]